MELAIQIIVGVVLGVIGWVIRLLTGKISALEDKIVNNSTHHYEKAEAQGNRITRLEAIGEIRNK